MHCSRSLCDFDLGVAVIGEGDDDYSGGDDDDVDDKDDNDDSGSWQRKCKTAASRKSEGQASPSHLCHHHHNFFLHHIIITIRYGNYSLEIRATDKGLQPNSASAVYNVNFHSMYILSRYDTHLLQLQN